MATEIEAKMKVEEFDTVRQRLVERGAERIGAVIETNTFFDTPDRLLLSADKGLRLRRAHDLASGREHFVLTVKGPQQQSQLKNREEAEVGVESGDDATRFLAALGFTPTLSFEKKRESWKLGGCKVELDEVPLLGRFIEIEGPDEGIVMRVREQLGLSDRPPIKTGYIAMLSRLLHDHGNNRRSITFERP